MRHKPKSLEEIGIENYLESTKGQHGNFGFTEFKRLFDSNVNPTNIAKAFNVDRRTVNRWIMVHEKELANVE